MKSITRRGPSTPTPESASTSQATWAWKATNWQTRKQNWGANRRQQTTTEPRVSLAEARRWRRDRLSLEYGEWWQKQKGYRPLGTGVPAEPPFRVSRYDGLTKIELGHILAARTGDGDFDEYHDRWEHNCPRGCRACNQPKERGHWWTCRALPRPWSQRFADKLLKTTKATSHVASVLRRNLKFLEERQQPERPETTQPSPTASTET
ncbi:uncharacterized protein BROUX77_005889 [Berkeleyomyces rouxiae]|uniref:uncharacterized protein n=1 Tax=Berkeleyomyces rouxiae TaxID=2035830 RepID=UPI003B77495F